MKIKTANSKLYYQILKSQNQNQNHKKFFLKITNRKIIFAVSKNAKSKFSKFSNQNSKSQKKLKKKKQPKTVKWKSKIKNSKIKTVKSKL